jgi:hypothetical protein
MVTINLPSTKEESTEENGAHSQNYPSLASHEHDKTKIKIKITYIRQQGNDNIAGCNNSRDSSQEIDHLKQENKLLSELVEFLKSRDK